MITRMAFSQGHEIIHSSFSDYRNYLLQEKNDNVNWKNNRALIVNSRKT